MGFLRNEHLSADKTPCHAKRFGGMLGAGSFIASAHATPWASLLSNSSRVQGAPVALREELEQSGNWLFQRRGVLPVFLICAALVTMRGYEYPQHNEKLDHAWEALCLLVSFTGLGLRALTVGFTPRNTSGRNTEKQEADTLNTTGIYSLVRNPLYLGNFCMYLGIALLTWNWWLVLVYVLVFCLYYERIIFAEEEFLRATFGQQYSDWADRTPILIPRLSGYRPPDLPFSLKNVLRREYNGFFALILVMFLFELVGDLSATRHLQFDTYWLALFAFGFVVWVVLRTLKKKTKFLNVDGR